MSISERLRRVGADMGFAGVLDEAASEIERKDQRIQELLEANNRYLERARKAERAAATAATLLDEANKAWAWGAAKSSWYERYQTWMQSNGA